MKVLSWNINGLRRKIVDEDFVNYISNYDLVFLNETWVPTHVNLNFDIPGYCCEFITGNKSRNTSRGRYSGGIAFYYRDTLKQYITVIQKEQSGILWIKVSSQLFPFDQDVYLCHIYVPPSNSRVTSSANIDLYDSLEQHIIRYNNLGKVFVCGDLNGRTADAADYFEFDKFLDYDSLFNNINSDIPPRSNKDRVIDYYGQYLLEICQSTGLIIANGRIFDDQNIGKYTFCSHQGQSTVDYLLMNYSDFDSLSHFDILDFNEFSDHAPMTFNFHIDKQIIQSQHFNATTDVELSRKIVWDETKVDDFKYSLSNENDHITRITTDISNEPIDDVVKNFSNFLHDKAFDIFGKTYGSKKTNQNRKSNKKWFDTDCRNAKHEFTRARNLFNRDKNDQSRLNFTRARTKYNRVKSKARKRFKQEEGRRLNDIAKKDSRKFWKHVKKTYKKSNISPTSLNVEQLHDHFKTLFGDQNVPNENTDPNHVINSNDEILDTEFTLTELHAAVFSQHNNKSPGMDNIPSEIIKASFPYIAPFLLNLYNKMFNNREYPRSWGESIIYPIFKKGDVNDAQNYRGITLISILAKIYSQLLLSRLTTWTTEHDTITNKQFGFQKGKSTTDCVFLLHSIISKVLNSGEKLYCVFIDYEKCFDKIDRSYLWQKLLTENISGKFVNAIKSMYAMVKLCIKYNNNFSQFFDSHIGLKQGDPSSPILFMLFVNDMIDSINSNLNGIFTTDEMKIFLILFADDQVVFAKSPQALQSLLSDIENYCTAWGIKININKTKAMIFEKGRQFTFYDFFIYNIAIELVQSFKYLGITLFRNNNWYRSQKCIAQHASFSLFNLFIAFNSVSLPISQKCKLFDSLVGSVLNFGAEIWGNHEATDIELIHTKFLRHILGVKKSTNLTALYGELGRVPMAIMRKIIMIKYWIKILKQNDDALVKKAYLMLKSDADIDIHYNGQNWAYQIKVILQQHGLEYIWNQQFEHEIPFYTIKQRIIDMYCQKWYTEINNSSRLKSYCIFKHDFKQEKYLDVISENKFKVALSRFRTSSHDLRIETGRYDDIAQAQRLCKSCNMGKTEDEFHFLLVCPKYRDLRCKYFIRYFCHWPTINKFENIMSSSSNKVLHNISKYIYFAMKIRVS